MKKKEKLHTIKKHLSEFLDFIQQQNIISLAIGFVLGGAVKNLVKSLVDNLINPIIGIFIGSTQDLAKYSLHIKTVEIRWGAFLSESINFIILAFVIFYTAKLLKIEEINKKVKIK